MLHTFFFSLLATSLGACDPPAPCFTGGVCPDAAGPDGGGDGAADAADAGAAVTGIAIEPGDPTVYVAPGGTAALALRVVAVHADGAREPVEGASLALADARLGTLAGAVFTANGSDGGDVVVTATRPRDPGGSRLPPWSAVATLRVVLRIDAVAAGEPPPPPELASLFDAVPVTDPTRAPHLLYPLEGALMPANVAPPEVHWDTGIAGDVYRVRIARPHAAAVAYVRHGGDRFAFAWTAPQQAWDFVRTHEPDAPIEVRVDRYDAAAREVVAGGAVRFTLARAALEHTAIYYWRLPPTDGSSGFADQQLVRLDPATGRRDVLIPNPPPYPGQPRPGPGSPQRCLGCHAVSRDGRYLAAVTGTGPSELFDLTADLDADPAPTVYTPWPVGAGPMFYQSSFSPDATRLVVSLFGYGGRPAGLLLLDPHTGQPVTATGLPSGNATSPDWSPDGRTVAFISNGNDSEDGATAGDLALLPVAGPDAFGPARIVHQGGELSGAAERGVADSHTSWSPDSRYLAFQHGPRSISTHGSSGALYVLPAAGGAAVRLNNLAGGVDASDSYWPAFAPALTEEAGSPPGTSGRRLYWLAFYSRRDFGNAQAGTRGTQRPQLWIAAVDADVRPDADPSHVPYRVPGQDRTTENMGPQLAPWPVAAPAGGARVR